MSRRFRIAYSLPRRLEELGLSPEEVLRRARLPRTLFDADKIEVTTDELFALYTAIGQSTSTPAIGLQLGAEDRPERYDPVAIAGLFSRTFRDAIERIARYKQLICPERLRLEDRDGESEVRFEWTLAGVSEPAVLVDHCFSWLVGIARRGTGQRLRPARVELRRPAAHAQTYERFFGSAVRFRAERDVLVFDSEDLELPFVSYNPDLLGVIAPQLEEALELGAASSDVSERAKDVIKRQLAGHRPTVREVARELRVSARTLQRRISDRGTTFQDLMKEARQELARLYLSRSSLELAEVAYLLGYEDANSFFRAFHRWEGLPPGQWRSEHGAA